jgi:putative peptidoglycan lipid II flippase
MASSLNRYLRKLNEAIRQPIFVIAIINLVVAIVAFAKDIALAAYVGTSIHADALTLAFFIPDSIGNSIFAGAISVVCVPLFSRLVALKEMERLRLSIRQVTIRFFLISILLMSTAYWFATEIIGWLESTSSTELAQLTLPLIRLLLPTIVLFVVIAIGTAVLQTIQRFFVPALAPLLFNIIFMGGVVYCILSETSVGIGVSRIALAITLGVSLMTIWVVISWYKSTTQLVIIQSKSATKPDSSSSNDWMDMLRMFIPYVVILLSIQSIYLAERYMITSFDSGTVAALNYSFRLTQFPIWVFVSAVSVVILPSLSKYMALGLHEETKSVMLHAIRGVIIIVLPSMLFLFFLREAIISALFQRGAFDAHSVILTSSILEGYSLSILCQAISLICLRYFLAKRKLATVLTIFVITAVATIVVDVGLIHILGSRGIGFGAAIGALLNAILLLYLLWKDLRPRFRSIVAELNFYFKVLSIPIIYFPIMRVIWFWLPTNISVIALIFILIVGSLFLLGYYLILRWYWPSFINEFNLGKEMNIL